MTSGCAQPAPHEIRYAGSWFHLLTGNIFPARLALFSGLFPNHGLPFPNPGKVRFADHSASRRSDCVLKITHRLQWRSTWRAKSPNIPHGRLAEEAAVFAIELASALVSDLECSTGGVQTIHEHAFPRCMQPKLFLILKRTHGGQHPEMVVQRGHAHPRDFLRDLPPVAASRSSP
jgi:hypothetical protein